MRQKSKDIIVSVINPPPGHRDTTSLAHARRYVRDEVADFVPGINAIEFRPQQKIKLQVRIFRDSHTSGVGFASLKGLAGTPVVANPIRLLTGKRPKESPRDWPDPVVLSRRMLPMDGSAA